MNKRCTNSSCRRTFSTLNASGRCPHCGKLYPQLACGRKNNDRIRLRVKSGNSCRCLNIKAGEMLRLGRGDKKVRMIKEFRSQVMTRGYHIGLKAARDYCVNLLEGKAVPAEWRLTGAEWNGLLCIEPVAMDEVPKKRKRKNLSLDVDLSDELSFGYT